MQGLEFIMGQQETGAQDGYLHWQLCVGYSKKVRLRRLKEDFGDECHAELTRSKAAEDYVFKDETAVEGTRFKLGIKVLNRNDPKFWDNIRIQAKQGELEDIDAQVYIAHYRTLKQIAKDNMTPPDDLQGPCGTWIWGPPGVGKSRQARLDHPNAYHKMANKWWDGYQHQEDVILDDMDPNHKCLQHHIKIWTDQYAFIAEAKNGAMFIRPKNFVVTSNHSPEQVFGDGVDAQAIIRRFTIVHMQVRAPPAVEQDFEERIDEPFEQLAPPPINPLYCRCGQEVFLCKQDGTPLCWDHIHELD